MAEHMTNPEDLFDDIFGRRPGMGRGDWDFVAKIVARFRRRHPRRKGWLVYRTEKHPDTSNTRFLPAFLKLGHEEDLLTEDLLAVTEYSNWPGAKRLNFLKAPHQSRGAGLCDQGWYGRIHFRWADSEIHVERHQPPWERLGNEVVTLMASKSRGALEAFLSELDRFRREVDGDDGEIRLHGGGSLPRPTLGWADLILPADMRDDIRCGVESFLGARDDYETMDLPYRRGFIFTGPPGCGKTTAVKVIAATARARIMAIQLKDDLRDRDLEAAFREASQDAPTILIVEDLDKVIQARNISVPFLLNLLDGLDTHQGFLIVGTSNEPEKIDPALLHRPSRFDRVWHFGLPEIAQRRELIVRRSGGRFSREAVDSAADRTAGFSMAYVQEAVVSAMLQALHEGREPEDSDLRDSVAKLRAQYESSSKADGALRPVGATGFRVGDNGREAG